MSANIGLQLPNPELMTDAYAAVHEEFAARSLDSFRSDMVDLRPVGYDTANRMSLVDLRHPNEASDNRAIIVPLPFGNPYTPAMHIRARAIQAFAPEGTRVLVVPNNTRNEKYYSFEGLESYDGVELLGNMILRACYTLGINEVGISGYSQGASVGASMIANAERFDVNVVGAQLGDPADVVPERTSFQLKRVFIASGSGLNDAINDSGIPALSEAQLSRGGIDAVRQLLGFAAVARNASLPENKSLHKSMTRNTFVRRLFSAVAEGSINPNGLVVSRMADSKVCTNDLLLDMVAHGLGTSAEVIEGYGHAGGDNVVDLALRTERTLVNAGFWPAAA